jgi:hypothetical protein
MAGGILQPPGQHGDGRDHHQQAKSAQLTDRAVQQLIRKFVTSLLDVVRRPQR